MLISNGRYTEHRVTKAHLSTAIDGKALRDLHAKIAPWPGRFNPIKRSND